MSLKKKKTPSEQTGSHIYFPDGDFHVSAELCNSCFKDDLGFAHFEAFST